MRKDFDERKIQTTVRIKWLQLAEAEGLDIDTYIERLQSIIEKKELQFEQILSVRDSLYNTLSEATELLKQMKEAIEQQKDLKIFLPKIKEFLQKV